MISVVIPSYNSAHTIYRCIDALSAQTYTGEYEIILADSSQDETQSIVKFSFPKVIIIPFLQKTDPGTARNAGVQRSKGDIIAFIDSDCVADKRWLEYIDSGHRAGIRILGGSVKNGNNPQNNVAWAGYIAEFREYLPFGKMREVSHIPTCNISYDRTIFEQYGYFDGRFYPQEDLVFNHVLTEMGEKIIFNPELAVYHTHRETMHEFISHQYKIGRITAIVLKMIPLEGSSLVKNKGVALLVLPFLPFVKFVRTLIIFMEKMPLLVLKRPIAFLVFAWGLISWTRGFGRGVTAKTEIPDASK
jgi:glycosyltransferase involved in cell wall biosynthesis